MNRNGLISHIQLWQAKLGSYAAVARKCNINVGSLSTIMAGKYAANEMAMLQKIAKELDYRERNWNIVRTVTNYKQIASVWQDAKNESMWFAIANPAGSGKSETLTDLFNEDKSGSVILIQAEEWSGRTFLLKLIERTVGSHDGGMSYNTTGKNYKSLAQLMDIVANYFNDKSLEKPVLLIDEADKLKPAALRCLIPIFNRTEDRLGVILSGTENLQTEIAKGVRLHKKGYDELESRFGRTYINLKGMTEQDVAAICAANGLTRKEAISDIWIELPKTNKLTTVKTATGKKDVLLPYVEDMRRLKRLIKREILKAKNNPTA